jgi:hypothetical protein
LAGFVVTAGAVFTVRVAALKLALPATFVKTARYRLPFWVEDVVKDNVVEVASAILLKVAPPSVLTCHCTVGVGWPVAAAVKVTACPAQIVWLTGLVVMAGIVLTVSVAAVVVADPQRPEKTARY